MNDEVKIIVIKDEDNADVEGVFIAPKDLNSKVVNTYIQKFKKENNGWCWADLFKSLTTDFNLKEISYDTLYLYM